MPTVPILSGPQVQAQELRPAFQQAPDVGGGMRALGAGLDSVSRAADHIAVQSATAESLQIQNNVRAAWLQKDSELRAKYVGANTDGYAAEVQKWWSTDAPAQFNNASPMAKEMAGNSLGSFGLQAQASAAHYVAQQRGIALDQGFDAAAKTTTQAALQTMTPTTAGSVGYANAAALAQQVAQYGAAKGWTTEQVQAETLARQSQLHGAAVAGLMNQSPEAARAYFDQHRGQIDARMAPRLEEALKGADELSAAQHFADDATGRGLTLDQALKEAGDKLDGTAEQQAKVELRRRYADTANAAAETMQRSYGRAQLEVEQTGRVTPSTFSMLDDTHKAAILERQQAQARQRRAEANATAPKTDWGLYADLRQQAIENPAAFGRQDLKRYVDRIAGPQMEQLLDLKQNQANAQQRAGAKSLREATTLGQQMTATMNALAIKKPEQKGQFMSFVQSAVDDATQAKGKPLNFDERQQIIDRAVLQGPDPDRWLPFGEKRMFQLTPGQRSQFKPNPASDAPATEVDVLNEALKQQGMPQTPANRLQLYQRAQQRNATSTNPAMQQ